MTDKFDPKQRLMQIKGKDYLPVQWRIVWFRSEHPEGGIKTTVESYDPLALRAEVIGKDGNILATGHGSAEKKQGTVWSGRELEKAETAAIGRALAHAGYGTQFTGEDEGENLADSPVEGNSGDDPTKMVGVLDGDTVKRVVELGIFENDKAAAQVLSRFKPAKSPLKKIIEKARLYRGHKDTGKPTDEAIAAANNGEAI